MGKYDRQWIIQYYDDYGSKEWERWEKSPADHLKFHVHKRWIEEYVKAGDHVLEIGAGAGRFTQVLAEVGAGIVVADISPGQLELNRRYAKALSFDHAVKERLQLDICDMRHLDADDYDAVLCYGGPLSYVFEKHDLAVREIMRVLRPSGIAMFSVMSLWGTVREYLAEILDVSPEENAGIIRTGDLHPDIYKSCKHRCHMFTAQEFRMLLERNGLRIIRMSASNCLSARWDARLSDIQNDPLKWSELIKMEIRACSETGCLDLGSHLISVAKKQANPECKN